MPFGIVAFGYTDADGDVAFDVEPGSYPARREPRHRVLGVLGAPRPITRGLDHERARADRARARHDRTSSPATSTCTASRSPDSRWPTARASSQFAGEGVENLIVTDHHVHTTYLPTMAALGSRQLGDVDGRRGDHHLRLRPLQRLPVHDRSERAVGRLDGLGQWRRRRARTSRPRRVQHDARPRSTRSRRHGSPRRRPYTTIQVNHIDRHFAPLQIDTALVPPSGRPERRRARWTRRLPSRRGGRQPVLRTSRRSSCGTAPSRAHQHEFLVERIGIWMNHLNKGLRTTAISDTDTHDVRRPEYGRRAHLDGDSSTDDTSRRSTWTRWRTRWTQGRAVGGQGIYVQTRLLAADGSGAVADLTSAAAPTSSRAATAT